jgi:hydrogenase nickel incorporation protein HypA/HybF
MHEQSIVESLLALALKNAEQNRAERIVAINLVVGDLSGVVEDAVNFYFNFLARDTIAGGATINYRRVPVTMRCRDCQRTFEPERLDLLCPDCGGRQLDIIAGRELYVESLEVV